MYSIAWRYNRNFSDLARWNGIRSPFTIFPGQMVRLKPRATASRPTVAKPAPAKKSKSATPPKSFPSPANSERKPSRSGALTWKWPVQGRILSRYSGRDATRNGLKLAGAVGQPVRAAEGGKVVYSGSGLIGYGRLIIIKHNEKYLSAYGHNSRLLVKEGQKVARGQQIADMGSSNTGTAMLHFEIRKNGRPIDPLSVLPRKK